MSHTRECIEARGGPDRWPMAAPFHRVPQEDGSTAEVLTELAAAIFGCSHPSHYAYHFIWGKTSASDAPRSGLTRKGRAQSDP